jgi:hypothetical protein
VGRLGVFSLQRIVLQTYEYLPATPANLQLLK